MNGLVFYLRFKSRQQWREIGLEFGYLREPDPLIGPDPLPAGNVLELGDQVYHPTGETETVEGAERPVMARSTGWHVNVALRPGEMIDDALLPYIVQPQIPEVEFAGRVEDRVRAEFVVPLPALASGPASGLPDETPRRRPPPPNVAEAIAARQTAIEAVLVARDELEAAVAELGGRKDAIDAIIARRDRFAAWRDAQLARRDALNATIGDPAALRAEMLADIDTLVSERDTWRGLIGPAVAELRESRQQLDDAAAAEPRVPADIAAARDRIEKARAERDDIDAALAGIEIRLDMARTRRERFAETLAALRAERDAIVEAVKAEADWRAGVADELAAARDDRDQAAADVQAARTNLDQARVALDAARAAVDAARQPPA